MPPLPGDVPPLTVIPLVLPPRGEFRLYEITQPRSDGLQLNPPIVDSRLEWAWYVGPTCKPCCAARVEVSFAVVAPRGRLEGRAGDMVCYDVEAVWVELQEVFRPHYRPL